MSMRILIAAAAALSLAGAAQAQKLNPPHVDMPIDAQLNRLVPPPTAPANTAAASNAAAELNIARTESTPYVADAVSGPTANPQVTASLPVPDTKENRKLYRPMSLTGQRSAPIGN